MMKRALSIELSTEESNVKASQTSKTWANSLRLKFINEKSCKIDKK